LSSLAEISLRPPRSATERIVGYSEIFHLKCSRRPAIEPARRIKKSIALYPASATLIAKKDCFTRPVTAMVRDDLTQVGSFGEQSESVGYDYIGTHRIPVSATNSSISYRN